MTAGFLLYISHDEFGRSIMNGVYDARETKLIKKLNLRGKTVYDIGAHHGYYSFLFWKSVGNDGQVFAFEPSPRERFFFKISKFLNHSKNIFLIPLGLSSRCGKAVFYQAQGIWTGFNSLRPPRYPKGYKVKTKKIVVDLVTLDSLVSSKSLPALIKIDVEGAEYSIVKGGKKMIMTNPPLLLMELEDQRSKAWGYKIRDLVQYLQKFGYLLFRITERGYLTKIKKESVYEGNYFLVPKKSVGKLEHLFKKNK
jgi:FkbM family methyltransferase